MIRKNWTDAKIIQLIQTGKGEEALKYLYLQSGWRGEILAWVRKNGGNEADGKDVFQEAIIVFREQVRDNKFKGAGSLKNYFYKIAKNNWYKRFQRKQIPTEDLKAMFDKSEEIEQQIWDRDKLNFFDQQLKKLSEGCQKVLTYFGQGFSMKEIAKLMNLANEQMARKKKYRCQKKLFVITE